MLVTCTVRSGRKRLRELPGVHLQQHLSVQQPGLSLIQDLDPAMDYDISLDSKFSREPKKPRPGHASRHCREI